MIPALKLSILAFSPLLLLACASQQPIADLDTDALCEITITEPARKAAAEAELGARQASCDWQKIALIIDSKQAAQARKTAAINTLLQAHEESMRASREAYRTQMEAIGRNNQRVQADCTTTYIGNQAHTSCR